MKINPFELNDIDIFNDDNFFLVLYNDNTTKLNKCNYIFGDEFHDNVHQNDSFALLHINARSLSIFFLLQLVCLKHVLILQSV